MRRPPKHSLIPASSAEWRLWLLVIGSWLIPRLAIWFLGEPFYTRDTIAYNAIARGLASLDLAGHKGFRTPGFPLLIILAGFNFHIVWAIHSLFLLSCSVMLFRISADATGSPWISTLPAVLLNTCYLFLYEPYMMPEVGAMLFVTLAAYGAYYFGKSHLGALNVGFALAGAILMRPSSLGIVPIFLVGVALLTRKFKKRIRAAIAILAPVAITWLGWAAVNAMVIGHFDYSINTGYALGFHSGPLLVRYRPPDWEHVSKIYVPLHEARIRNPVHLTYFDAVWDAHIPLKTKLSVTDAQLNQIWKKLSLDLFRRYPVDYLQSVAMAWPTFWRHFHAKDFSTNISSSIRTWTWYYGYPMTLVNWLAVGTSLFWLARWLVNVRTVPFAIPELFAAVLIGAATFHALMIPCTLPRYGIPFQPLAVLVACFGCLDIRRRFTSGKHACCPVLQ